LPSVFSSAAKNKNVLNTRQPQTLNKKELTFSLSLKEDFLVKDCIEVIKHVIMRTKCSITKDNFQINKYLESQ